MIEGTYMYMYSIMNIVWLQYHVVLVYEGVLGLTHPVEVPHLATEQTLTYRTQREMNHSLTSDQIQ